eukprot:384404-Rhodomonas_salina.1
MPNVGPCQVKKGTYNPVWNQAFVFQLNPEAPLNCPLYVTLYDWDRCSSLLLFCLPWHAAMVLPQLFFFLLFFCCPVSCVSCAESSVIRTIAYSTILNPNPQTLNPKPETPPSSSQFPPPQPRPPSLADHLPPQLPNPSPASLSLPSPNLSKTQRVEARVESVFAGSAARCSGRRERDGGEVDDAGRRLKSNEKIGQFHIPLTRLQ